MNPRTQPRTECDRLGVTLLYERSGLGYTLVLERSENRGPPLREWALRNGP